ncbi:MAG: trimeric intracellular cation channel family protein [Coprococcus sp.]|nr:trimeric intracellular cation channel family protein [Coprococcus sp.]
MTIEISVLSVMEIIGTIAFAFSGAMVAVEKRLDFLGIIVLAVTTSVGGGMFRDILIGDLPPVLFRKPIYVTIAVITAILFFFIEGSKRVKRLSLGPLHYDWFLNLMDATGLGAFTVVGVNKALSSDYDEYIFLTIFLGVITGVGGGLLRDIMANRVPSVLREHIYACASLVGAVFYWWTRSYLGQGISMIVSAILVIVIRVLSKHYDWNLPQCKVEEEPRE